MLSFMLVLITVKKNEKREKIPHTPFKRVKEKKKLIDRLGEIDQMLRMI